MKKSKIIIFMIFISASFFMISCEKNEKETLIKDFLTEFYTVDSVENFDDMEYQMTYTESEKVKKLESYLADGVLKPVTTNRTHLIYVLAANHKGIDISVSDFSIEEYTENEKGIVYNYKVKLIFKEDEDSEEHNVSGQLTVNKVEGDLLISQINKIAIPDRIFHIHKEMTNPKDD